MSEKQTFCSHMHIIQLKKFHVQMRPFGTGNILASGECTQMVKFAYICNT